MGPFLNYDGQITNNDEGRKVQAGWSFREDELFLSSLSRSLTNILLWEMVLNLQACERALRRFRRLDLQSPDSAKLSF